MNFCTAHANHALQDIFYLCGTLHCPSFMTAAMLNGFRAIRFQPADIRGTCARIGTLLVAQTYIRWLKLCRRS